MELKEEFEQIYSLSIRRGDDSATVWEWFESYKKNLMKDIKARIKELSDLRDKSEGSMRDIYNGSIIEAKDMLVRISLKK